MAEGKGIVLGYLKYVLGFDSLAFQAGVGDADKRMKAAQRSLAKTAEKFTSIGAIMSVGITAPFTALVATSIPAAKESAEALGQVQAALTSMGDAAQRSLPQLQDQAKALMQMSTFDDDDILRKVTANLLTFGNVSGEVFDRAQVAAINLSARLGQDLQSSALQLGKALNDPVKGLTALSRVGVSFTAEQKAQIQAMTAAGDAAGAQSLILKELEKQYGGAAEAQRKATPGIESQQAWADFQETVGQIALKVLPALSRMLADVLNWFNKLPEGTQTFIIGATAVAAVLGPIAIGIGGVVSGFGLLLPAIGPITAAIGALSAMITGAAIPAIGAMLTALSPILLPLAAVAAAIAAVVIAWKNWDKIKPYIDMAVKWISDLYHQVKYWLVDKLGAVFTWVKDQLALQARLFYKLYDAVVGHSYVPDMVDGIAYHMARLDQEMVKVAQSATAKTAKAFEKLDGDVKAIMDRLFPERARAAEFLVEQNVLTKIPDPEQRAEAQRRLADQYSATLPRDLTAAASSVLETAGKAAAQTAERASAAWKDVALTTDGIRSSFADSAETIGGTLQSIVSVFRGNGNWLDKLLGAVELGARAYGQISGQFGGFRATGGPVLSGSSYVVGERGPELFTPSRSGYVTPNKEMQGRAGGGMVFDMRGAVVTEDLLRQMDALATTRSATVLSSATRTQGVRSRQRLG
jgi:hypothetical protein